MFDEQKLITIAKPYLSRCRSGDWSHACRVVSWVKVLGDGRSDLSLLVVAAYLHDIGWVDLMQEGKVDFDVMLKYESQANQNTEGLVREVLAKLEFSEDDVDTVLRLIRAADKHESTKDDEAILVDADSLSKLCVEHMQDKYQPESYSKIIELWEKEFPTRFKTEKGKELFPKLLKELKEGL